MNQSKAAGIDRSNLSAAFLAVERRKSNLILEANLLQQQGQYEAAADKFALAAALEEDLVGQLLALERHDKAYLHQFSALSCWVQAGDLHRALSLGQQLLRSTGLSASQHEQLTAYLDTVRNRLALWMSQWAAEPIHAA